jgi:hypothetical protein
MSLTFKYKLKDSYKPQIKYIERLSKEGSIHTNYYLHILIIPHRLHMSMHGVWSNRFIISAIVQGAIITGLTISIVSIQMLFSSKINIIQFLSLSFEGPAKWFFLGYIFYMILVVAIAVTATFYHHLEFDMRKSIRGFKSVLAWIHLVGMNVGGAATTLTMIFAGLIGSGILSVITSGPSTSSALQLQQNVGVMVQFIPPISAFAGLLSIGVLSGGITYITTYLQKSDNLKL